MKNKPLIIASISLIAAIFLSASVKSNSNKISAELPPDAESKPTFSSVSASNNQEMRAVWVPFMSLNMKDTDYSEAAFKTKFDNIIEESLAHNMNTLIVHVRPFNDALYPSDYFPWSHLISGEQGKNPEFDPLDYMITATHKAGLQFHAWINPLRIQINNMPSLCESNVYYSLKNGSNPEDIIMETSNGKYLNPAYPNVRELIINGVKEVVEKYPVDGVQFDDYFYPDIVNVINGEFFVTINAEVDKIAYGNYCNLPGNNQPLSLEEWRFANINALISGVYSAIKSINANVVFGISPGGNINNQAKIGADILTWCNTPVYIDYICPQIYFSPDHPKLPSTTAFASWKNIVGCDKVKLYFGLAAYKAGSETDDFGTWKNHDDILKTQVEQGRHLGCDGFMFFSFEDFKKPRASLELQNVKAILN